MKKKKKNLDLEELARENQSYNPQYNQPVDPDLNGYYGGQQVDPYQNPNPQYGGQFYGDNQGQVPPQYVPSEEPPTTGSRTMKHKEDKRQVKFREPDDEEKKFKKKLRKRYIVRGCLIVVNLALVGYLVYQVTGVIQNQIKKNNEKDNQYIYLLDSSKSKSESLYKKYEKDGYKSVFDYSLVGQYFFLSENHIEADKLTNMTSLQMVQVKDDGTNDVILDSNLRFEIDPNSFTSGINLFSSYVRDGDYLIYQRTTEEGVDKCYPLKVKDTNIDVTLYSLPNKDSERKVINIRNTKVNKALVINVETTKSMPVDHYDMVIATSDKDFTLPESLADYKIKVCKGDNYLVDAYKTEATYAVLADEDTGIALKSQFDTKSTYSADSAIKDGRLQGLDRNDFIREMTGYVQNAGQGYSSSDEIDNSSIAGNIKTEHVGKIAYVIPTTILEIEVAKILG